MSEKKNIKPDNKILTNDQKLEVIKDLIKKAEKSISTNSGKSK